MNEKSIKKMNKNPGNQVKPENILFASKYMEEKQKKKKWNSKLYLHCNHLNAVQINELFHTHQMLKSSQKSSEKKKKINFRTLEIAFN